MYLRQLGEEASLPSQQKRLAIFQLIRFAHSQRSRVRRAKEDPKKTFLNYIRRIELQGDERSLREVPEWASGLDAVRLLTVHASKGLAFTAVFIPYVGNGIFPKTGGYNPCPPPKRMISDSEFAKMEEEECLFHLLCAGNRSPTMPASREEANPRRRRPARTRC